ncbi:MAG: hypothetical protein KIS88_05745 [Anaerolineales bacterium]|nr:hypothetical protein [Anaerolineales bacterium]
MKLRTFFVGLLAVLLAACQPAPQPTTPPTARQTVLPTPRPTRTPTAAPSAAPSATRALDALQAAIAQQDAAAIVALVNMDYRFGYASYIEGGQSVTLDEFRADLEARLPSVPVCLGYWEEDNTLQVWFEGWSPAWEIHEHCYAECQPLDEIWYSTTAGFLLNNEEGAWVLKALFLNEPGAYYYREVALQACD